MFNFIKRHKVLSLLLFLNVVAVLVVVLVIVIHASKTATVDIKVAPIDATVELNGTKYENLQSHNIAPGDYQVKISMEGMQTKEFEISVENDGFVRIWTYLLDENGRFEYYMDHSDDAEILKDVADDEAKAWLEELSQVWGIREVLPLTFSNTFEEKATEVVSISVRWGENDECNEKAYCLIIHDFTGNNTEKALSMIRDAGYDPNDYELVFEKGSD